MGADAELLRACPVFADLTPAEAESITAACVQRQFAPGERLFQEGEPGRSLLVLTDGIAALTRGTPSGQTMELGRCRGGEVLGEMALLDAAPRSATVTALTPVTALEMRRITFEGLVSAATPAASKILHQLSLLLSQRLRAVIERLEEELMTEVEEEAILNHDSVYSQRLPRQEARAPVALVRPLPPEPGEPAPVKPTPADDRHGELWRVLWGVRP